MGKVGQKFQQGGFPFLLRQGIRTIGCQPGSSFLFSQSQRPCLQSLIDRSFAELLPVFPAVFFSISHFFIISFP